MLHHLINYKRISFTDTTTYFLEIQVKVSRKNAMPALVKGILQYISKVYKKEKKIVSLDYGKCSSYSFYKFFYKISMHNGNVKKIKRNQMYLSYAKEIF